MTSVINGHIYSLKDAWYSNRQSKRDSNKTWIFYATLNFGLFALCPIHIHTHTHTIFLQTWPILDTSAACLTTVRNDKITS